MYLLINIPIFQDPVSPCPGSWVPMGMRIRRQSPHRCMLYRDLGQIIPKSQQISQVIINIKKIG